MKKQFNLRTWLIQWLRRGSYRVPNWFTEVKAQARVSRGVYQCRLCRGLFKNGEYSIDHINPAVDPIRGFVSWDEYVYRLYCGPSGLQLLCKPCHKEKTQKENKSRKKAA